MANPITAATPEEIPLPDAPLVRVIAQIRFPPIAVLSKEEAIASFQEALRDRYPVLRPEQIQGIQLGPGGVAPIESRRIWRFHDIPDAWRVTLAPDFVALETTAYESRADFIERLSQVLSALTEHVRPALADRIGVRYIDRLLGDDVENINNLVRKEVLGVVSTEAAEHIQHTITETLFDVGQAVVLMRTGRFPSGASYDPGTIPPTNSQSWVLDIDMATKAPQAYDADVLLRTAYDFAERIYTIFRWAVTDQFLRRFGGKL